MKLKLENKTIEGLTIKELYEMAVAQGKENALVGICFDKADTAYCPECDEMVDIDIEYVEEIQPTDVEFGGYYHNGEKIYDCIWLNNHAI